MVAINFNRRFLKPIRMRIKTHTLRKRFIMPGTRLQLYVGQRTRYCERIFEDDVVCIECHTIDLREKQVVSPYFRRRFGVALVDDPEFLARFALADGFKSYDEMLGFFDKMYGDALEHHLFLIGWGSLAEYVAHENKTSAENQEPASKTAKAEINP